MYATDSFLTFSFPIGRLLGVPLRLSFLIPVVVVAAMWRLGDPVFGIMVGMILLLSLLLHEVAHLFVARQLDHSPGTIVLWPLGGMSSAAPPSVFRGGMLLAFAGPLVNFIIAGVSGWELHRTGQLNGLLNPFGTFDLKGTGDISASCLMAVFVINWCVGLFNLVPVRPLDAGQALLTFLQLRFVEAEARDLMLRIGLIVSLVGILAGFVFDISSLVALSAFLLVLHIQEATRWFQPHESDESFMGYDFSEGYTSLDRNENNEVEERARRDADERQAEVEQVDLILEKLHTQGRGALTYREISLLNRVSARLRHRNTQELKHRNTQE
jgi:stage IV sporulation protein FB